MSSYALGRSPALWEDASEFRPVRMELSLQPLGLRLHDVQAAVLNYSQAGMPCLDVCCVRHDP
jgi:cytochrome P450